MIRPAMYIQTNQRGKSEKKKKAKYSREKNL